MATQWTPYQSMPSQDSNIGFCHNIEKKNPTNEAVGAYWQPPVSVTSGYVAFDNPWGVNPEFDDLHSYFPGPETTHVPIPNIHGDVSSPTFKFPPPSLQRADGPVTARRISPATGNTIEALDPTFKGHPNPNGSGTLGATSAQRYGLPRNHTHFHAPPYTDPRAHDEPPSLPPAPQQVQTVSVPTNDSGRSSRTTPIAGSSLPAQYNGTSGLEHGTTRTPSPSGPLAQEHRPTTEEAPRGHEDKTRAKKERDKTRKRKERSDNSQYHARICELLEIPLLPKNTLASRILNSVEELVKLRELYGDSQRLLEQAGSEIAVLKERFAQVESKVR